MAPVAPAEGRVVSDQENAAQFARMARKAGPGAVRFIEYCAGEFWRRARASALEQGFTYAEAEQIARQTVAGAVKGMASEVALVRKLRGFGIRN